MMHKLSLSLALATLSLAACDGCGEATGTPNVRIDDNEPVPVGDAAEGEGEGGASGSGGTGSPCPEIGPCESPPDDGTDTSGGEGEGEGSGPQDNTNDEPTEPDPGTGTSDGDPGEGEGEEEEPPPPPQAMCTDETFHNGERVAPRIMLVVDKSGSMRNAVGQDYPVSKWATTRSTIIDVVNSLDDDASFGLTMFPGMNAEANLCASGDEYVPMQANAAAAISESLNAVVEPRGATPTAASLRDVKDLLDALPAQGGTRAVVLATDGGPNCNLELDADTCQCTPGTECSPTNPEGATRTNLAPANCIDDTDAVAAARALNDAGYAVFVVGIPGIDGLENVMNALADAGGTARVGAVRYYDAMTSTDLAGALEDAAFRVSTCRFDLAAPVSSASDITVRIDGASVPRDPSRSGGWDLVDSDTVELFGDTCVDGANAAAGVIITACR